MNRRNFFGVLASAALGPSAARAQQQQPRRRRLDVLLIGTPESRAAQTAAYSGWLEHSGWKAGLNLELRYSWAASNPQALRDQAADLAKDRPDVILVESSAALRAVRQASPLTPIVFVMVGDPVGSGFVNSLAHPGGNITGFTNFESSMAGKWLEVLKELAPSTQKVAVLIHPDESSHANYWRAAEAASPILNLELARLEVRSPEDIERAFDKLAKRSDQGLVVLPHLLTASNRKSIISLAAKHPVPAVYGIRFFAEDGGLVSYGVDSQDLFRRAFDYIDRIFRGMSPSDLPVQAPNKFDLVINLRTAKALGLSVPSAFLARADEVIE